MLLDLDFPSLKPELVMFDLDGTLVDSVPDLSAALDEVLLDEGYPAAGEYKARLWVGNGSPMLVRRALADALREPEEQVNSELHARCLASFFLRYHHFNGRYATLFPGVLESLQLLRDSAIRMAVITNKPAQFVPSLLSQLGILGFFSSIIGGDSLEEKKPDPSPLLHVLREQRVRPIRALMVGDSVNDIKAARSAGVGCLAVAYGYNRGRPVEMDRPDWITDNLADYFAAALAHLERRNVS